MTKTKELVSIERLIEKGWKIKIEAELNPNGLPQFSVYGSHENSGVSIDVQAHDMEGLNDELAKQVALIEAFEDLPHRRIHVFAGGYFPITDTTLSDEVLIKKAEAEALARMDVDGVNALVDETEVRREDNEVFVCLHVACSVSASLNCTSKEAQKMAGELVDTHLEGENHMPLQIFWTKELGKEN